MPRIDLWWPSATRVEVDQRSRAARLRLDHLERLLALRILPAQSWLRRGLCRPGLRIFDCGERLDMRSPDTTPIGPQPRQMPKLPAEIGAAVRLYAGSLSLVGGLARNRRAA